MIATVLIFLVLLSVLVFVHELGHFLVARACGMNVEEFGFGFPPRAFSIRRGHTLISINWIPLGGFVKIKGENGKNRTDTDSFAFKPVWQRASVLLAGVTMNFLLACVLLSIVSWFGAPMVIQDPLPSWAKVSHQHVSVAEVLPNSPASRAGIVPTDELVSIDGHVMERSADARAYIADHAKEGMDLVLKKEDQRFQTFHVTGELLSGHDTFGVGIALVETGIVSYPWPVAMIEGIWFSSVWTFNIARAFVDLIGQLLLHGNVDLEVSGPLGIAAMTGEVAAKGMISLLQFTALLSVNLAVLNILPIPALDGGRLLLLVLEKIRGRAFHERAEALAHNLGFIFLMVLVMVVTLRDVVRLFH